jgi:hypothetical protein
MKIHLRYAVFTLALSLAACSPAVRQGPPAPVVGGGAAAPAPKASPGNVAVTPLETPRVQAVQQEPAQPFKRVEPEVVAAGAATPAKPPPPIATPPQKGGAETVAMAAPAGTSKAVRTLLQQADSQRGSGDLTAAAATLERALRIEPENPYVWNRLAHVRYKQGQAGLAGELAAKSNAFAGTDDAIKRDNDSLIARSRR